MENQGKSKKQIDDSENIACYAVIALVILMIVLAVIYQRDNHIRLKEMEDRIEESIEKRSYLDSLYWAHLEKCAFIHKDSIGIGYQGYLYDKYSRKYQGE